MEIQGKRTYTERGYTRKEDLYRKGIYTGTYTEKGQHMQKENIHKYIHKKGTDIKTYWERGYTQRKDIQGKGTYTETYTERNIPKTE